MKDANEIRLEEYQTLRAELDDQVKAMRQVEIYAVTGIAAVYAWLAVHIDLFRPGSLAWWLPTGIAAFGFLKNRAFLSAMRAITAYMLEIEKTIVVEGTRPLNWYHHLQKKGKRTRLFDLYDAMMWPGILVLTLIGPVVARSLSHH
jgi:hypothetical protein